MIKKPILSDKDKRNVLSARKKQKVILKNLLVQPFERYWPELTPDDVQNFAQKFRGVFKSTSSDNSNAPTNAKNVQKNKDLGSKVVLGLSSSIRCVSSGKTLALFISSKIRPRYIVDQIIAMTVTTNADSRIFCVPDMDVALSDVLGFSCQCLAILEDRNEIWQWSVEKAKQFPLPKSFRSLPTKNEKMEVEPTDIPGMVVRETNTVDVSTLYLRKENADCRAFIPRHGTISKNDAANEFISLGETNLKIGSIRPKHQLLSTIKKSEMPFTKTVSNQRHFVPPEKFSMNRKKKMLNQQQFHQNKVNYLQLKVNRVQSNSEKIRNKNKKKNKNKK